MWNPVRLIRQFSPLILLGVWMFSAGASAAETADTEPVPLKSMSQAEYKAYREQLQQKVKEAEAKAVEQDNAADEEAAKEKDKSGESGYGRGYRSRAERGGRTGGGYRGGSMSRGGGRGR